MLNYRSVALGSAFTMVFTSVAAQELQLQDLQKNIDIFSGVLEEALELDQSSRLFGLSLGGIENIYLYGQGVVMEVRSPLASRRNRMSLASLSTTMQSLQSRQNPFAPVTRPSAPIGGRPVLPLSLSGNEANSFYQDMMDKIANIDYSLVIDRAIQQALEAARSMRSMGNIDVGDYEAMRAEIEGMRAEMQAKMSELRAMELEVRQSADQNVQSAAGLESAMQAKLDGILANIEPLRQRAVARAVELLEQSKIAEQEYAVRWRADIIELEATLYAVICDYGSTLRELPENESISIVLSGLGEEVEGNRRTDKVHVLKKTDVLQCQTGEIDLATLQQRAVQYSY